MRAKLRFLQEQASDGVLFSIWKRRWASKSGLTGEVLRPAKPLGQCAATLFGALLRPQNAGGGGISHLNLLVLDLAAEVEVVGNFHVGRLSVGV